MKEETRPYGQILIDELKEKGHFMILTTRMNYSDIQELKSSDREGTLKAFKGSDYAFIQRIKNDSPSEVADFLIERTLAASNGALFTLMIMGGF
ncbi:MAG: hypothetical protein ACI97A_000784 [Planctomycetota bacterium]|jgi:hypothetical protein